MVVQNTAALSSAYVGFLSAAALASSPSVWRSCATSWSLSLDNSVLIWASGVARILMMLGHRKGTGCGKMTTELNSEHRSATTLAYPLLLDLVSYRSCFTSSQALSK